MSGFEKDKPSAIRAVWISGAYGYGGELLYFRDIFAEFSRRFPAGIVPVARDFPADHYPDLPLAPILGFHRFGRVRRTVGGVPYVGVRRIPTVASWWRLFRLRADVFILIEFSPTALVGFLVAKLSGRRTALLIESDPRYRGAPGGRLSLSIKRMVVRRVDTVLSSNQIGARFLREVLGADPDRITVGPYLTSLPPGADAGAALRKEHGTRIRLLFLNSVTDRKGLLQLVQALEALPEAARERWVLDVVGSGSGLEPVLVAVQALGLSENVIFHGRVPYEETGKYYAGSDLVVCPTLADYRSLGGFEAVNAGKPVLVSCYDGAHQEVLASSPAAFLIDPRDRRGFTEVLEQLLLNESALRGAQHAAAAVPSPFSVEGVGSNLQRAVLMAVNA
ncbi:glycosyltransferase family 4 protein [Arthrobacter sp. NPDC058192]|uniref:glycosyltransferase family 4 protein n=1 Tax=Arthrobacter sp. NPDC058192 TaxID=3346372 RepID=UPI0036E1FF4D